MKLSDKQRTLIILGIALLFILFGLSQALFKFNVNKEIVDRASFILVVIAAALFFSGRKKKVESEEENEEDQKQN